MGGDDVELYLIRHANALALGERGITDDAERPLSEQGEDQAHSLAMGLRSRGITFDGIISSPLVRAKQTADILVRDGSPAPPEIQICDGLLPDARPRKLARFLKNRAGQRLALIGHCPHLPQFAAWLIGGKKAQLDLAKSGVACIHCANSEAGKGEGTLQWLVTLDWFANGKG
jgi:phosphohistidine phosphatase